MPNLDQKTDGYYQKELPRVKESEIIPPVSFPIGGYLEIVRNISKDDQTMDVYDIGDTEFGILNLVVSYCENVSRGKVLFDYELLKLDVKQTQTLNLHLLNLAEFYRDYNVIDYEFWRFFKNDLMRNYLIAMFIFGRDDHTVFDEGYESFVGFERVVKDFIKQIEKNQSKLKYPNKYDHKYRKIQISEDITQTMLSAANLFSKHVEADTTMNLYGADVTKY